MSNESSESSERRVSSSRRQFLKGIGLGGLGTAAGAIIISGQVPASEAAAPLMQTQPTAAAPAAAAPQAKKPPMQVLPPNPTHMIIGDPSRCVGCRRCELICTATHEGKYQPSIARIKVGRNVNFGPDGPQQGAWRGEGIYGNHRVIQDICNQCPHPVPCMLACPNGAIETVAPTNARVINKDKCTGCRTCNDACPWEMISYDKEAQKSTKCDLCGGDPQCVKYCPTGALRYVTWRNRTSDVPRRQSTPAHLAAPEGVQESCVQCHK